jgi:hypothetical protein
MVRVVVAWNPRSANAVVAEPISRSRASAMCAIVPPQTQSDLAGAVDLVPTASRTLDR